jgi:hypothetical protein
MGYPHHIPEMISGSLSPTLVFQANNKRHGMETMTLA